MKTSRLCLVLALLLSANQALPGWFDYFWSDEPEARINQEDEYTRAWNEAAGYAAPAGSSAPSTAPSPESTNKSFLSSAANTASTIAGATRSAVATAATAASTVVGATTTAATNAAIATSSMAMPSTHPKNTRGFFSIDYDAAANAFAGATTAAVTQAVPAIANSVASGVASGVGQSIDAGFERVNTNMNANGHGGEAIRKLIENFTRALNDNLRQGGQGQQATENFFKMFADQFGQQGQGNKLFTEFFQSLKRLVEKGGAADSTVNEVVRLFKRQFEAGGELEQLLKEGTNFLNKRFQEGGELDEAADGILKGITNQTEKLREKINEGGAFDNLRADATSIVTRTYNELVDGLVNRNILMTSAAVAASIALTAGSYYGSKILWKWVEQEFFKPKLIISYDSKSAWSRFRSALRKKLSTPMIFPQMLEDQLNDLVAATRNIHKKIMGGHKNVKYRNLLLWGPPGTGKTMFAKRLAEESGLAWAHMSGSSFSKFKDGEGIQALDELMQWAKKQKGLLIFIDEAESFIAKREKMDPNSKAYQLLTNFLNYTGERSDQFMIVMATNHKDVIDSAMHRRIDDLVYVPLPEREERMQVIALYRDKILLDTKQNSAAFVASARTYLTDRKIADMASKTTGLSNGDLEGIINIIKTDADITDDGLVTTAIIDRAVARGIEKHHSFAQAARG